MFLDLTYCLCPILPQRAQRVSPFTPIRKVSPSTPLLLTVGLHRTSMGINQYFWIVFCLHISFRSKMPLLLDYRRLLSYSQMLLLQGEKNLREDTSCYVYL